LSFFSSPVEASKNGLKKNEPNDEPKHFSADLKKHADIPLNSVNRRKLFADFAKYSFVIRRNATPRHVPSVIVAVEDIPRTKSGKIVELAVRETVHDRPVKNLEALANPESLKHFANLEELRFQRRKKAAPHLIDHLPGDPRMARAAILKDSAS
jgi:hypothetical protein